MRRRLIEVEGIDIPGYGAMYALSAVVCVAVLGLLLTCRRQNAAPAVDLTLIMLISYTWCARVLNALLSGEREFFLSPGQAQMSFGFWGGSLAFAALGGAYLLATRAPFGALADALAVAWAFITVPHKLACYLSGCCYGRETTLPWGVVFPEGSLCHLAGRPVHPSQLYAAGGALLVGLALLVLYARRAQEGRLILWWGCLHGVVRVAADWTRADAPFTLAGPFTAAMAGELAVVGLCLFLLARPLAWRALLVWRELRTSAFRPPGPPIGRVFSFLLVMANLGLGVLLASLAFLRFGSPWAASGVFIAYIAATSLVAGVNPILAFLGYRVVDGRGERPGLVRLLIRAVVAVFTPGTVIGLLRPLMDRQGRALPDACAGTWLVRRGAGTASETPTS